MAWGPVPEGCIGRSVGEFIQRVCADGKDAQCAGVGVGVGEGRGLADVEKPALGIDCYRDGSAVGPKGPSDGLYAFPIGVLLLAANGNDSVPVEPRATEIRAPFGEMAICWMVSLASETCCNVRVVSCAPVDVMG